LHDALPICRRRRRIAAGQHYARPAPSQRCRRRRRYPGRFHLGRHAMNSALLQASGPVIPNYGGSACTKTFCFSWVTDNWDRVLGPALLQHVYVTLIALGCGLVISLAAAFIAFRMNWFEKGFNAFATILYTIPTLAFVQLFVPFTGIGLLTMELALTGYTFLLLFRNILTGLRSTPPEAVAAATGMGMTRN